MMQKFDFNQIFNSVKAPRCVHVSGTDASQRESPVPLMERRLKHIKLLLRCVRKKCK